MGTTRQAIFEMALDGRIDLSGFLEFGETEDINARFQGATLLHHAVDRNVPALVKALLAHPDTDVNARDPDGATALRHVLRRQRHRLFPLFLKHPGLDPDADVKPDPLYPYQAQPVALDLGRRGTVEMAEAWQSHQGAGAWSARGEVDEHSERQWWPSGRGRGAPPPASALDCALLAPNVPMIAWLLEHSDLLPEIQTLTVKLHDVYCFDNNGHFKHPGRFLAKALGTPESDAVWHSLSTDSTQTELDVAMGLRHYLERERMGKRLPDVGPQLRRGRL